MTRKDYIKFAKVINGLTQNNLESFTPNNLIEELSVIFKEDNRNFKRETFVDACGFTVSEFGTLKPLD
jgi:hypothetical protein